MSLESIQGAFHQEGGWLIDYLVSLLLQKYGDSSFQSCKDETEEVMEKVIRHMEDLVVSDAADTDDRAEAVQLLEQLNQPVGHEVRKFGRPVCACWVSMSCFRTLRIRTIGRRLCSFWSI
jgi:transcriptional/translational regulatory protein YebC/TACO1